MNIWSMPVFLNDILHREGLLSGLYDAMSKDDLADVVMEAYSIMKKLDIFPNEVRQEKNSVKSAEFRNIGNKAFKNGQYQRALEFYNQALMFAPKGSLELVLGYSNRSALLFQNQMFAACLKDIETCLALGCPESVNAKLCKRRQDAERQMWQERLYKDLRYTDFVKEYCHFNEPRNPQIPCASADVGVVVKDGVPTVVAVNDVKIGKLLALEKAFVNILNQQLKFVACFYCNQMSLNLLPCEGCCVALFCSKDCQQTCLNEYHREECAFIANTEEQPFTQGMRLALKAALKLRKKFHSWQELIEASSKLGLQRIKASEINEIFDGNNKFSLLNFNDDTTFVYSPMYEMSFVCAMSLKYLGNLKAFFPVRSDERIASMRAFGRLMMYHVLHGNISQIMSVESDISECETRFCNGANLGMFPLVGKLRHACNANVLAVGLNNKLALVAVQPLKSGTELTISYVSHWLDNLLQKQIRFKMLFLFKAFCACAICKGELDLIERNTKLSDNQLRCLQKINFENICSVGTATNRDVYQKCCKALALLSDTPFSKEYRTVYRQFRRCLLDIQNAHSNNYVLQSKDN